MSDDRITELRARAAGLETEAKAIEAARAAQEAAQPPVTPEAAPTVAPAGASEPAAVPPASEAAAGDGLTKQEIDAMTVEQLAENMPAVDDALKRGVI